MPEPEEEAIDSDEESFELSPAEEAALIKAAAEAERGETVDAAALLRKLSGS